MQVKDFVRQVNPEDREKVYDILSLGSNPDFDFFLMVLLSSIIATFGLITNSTAVIVGAMLVAPLMLPVISLSLGVISGNLYLFSKSIEAEIKGIALAVGVATLLTLLSPNVTPGYEIVARTHPTLFDLLIALAAGAAGAYAISKPKLSATLPGVAIAVAVLPPLSVVGIGLGIRRFDIAGGALLLFLSNLVAINVASSVIFWLLGFGVNLSKFEEKDTMRKLQISAALLLIISVPLGWVMLNTLNEASLRNTIEATLKHQIEGMEDTSLVDFSYDYGRDGNLAVTATINSPTGLSNDRVSEMRNALEKNLNRQVELTVKVVVVEVVKVSPTPA